MTEVIRTTEVGFLKHGTDDYSFKLESCGRFVGLDAYRTDTRSISMHDFTKQDIRDLINQLREAYAEIVLEE